MNLSISMFSNSSSFSPQKSLPRDTGNLYKFPLLSHPHLLILVSTLFTPWPLPSSPLSWLDSLGLPPMSLPASALALFPSMNSSQGRWAIFKKCKTDHVTSPPHLSWNFLGFPLYWMLLLQNPCRSSRLTALCALPMGPSLSSIYLLPQGLCICCSCCLECFSPYPLSLSFLGYHLLTPDSAISLLVYAFLAPHLPQMEFYITQLDCYYLLNSATLWGTGGQGPCLLWLSSGPIAPYTDQ